MHFSLFTYEPDCGLVSPVPLAPPTPTVEPPAIVLLVPIWSDSLTLDGCSSIDDVLDTLAIPLVVTPLNVFVLVVIEKALLEGSEELTDMACMLIVEDWWLSDISKFGFDVGAVLVTPSLFTV